MKHEIYKPPVVSVRGKVTKGSMIPVLEIRYVSVGYIFIKMSNKVNKVTKVMATCLLNYQNTL